MKKTGGSMVCLVALVLLALVSSVNAETLTATVPLTPGAEVDPSPPPPANATGGAVVTITVNRDGSGNVTSGAINFLVTVSFPGSVTVTGLHIHEGVATANGTVVFNSGLSGSNSMTFASGSGLINLNATSVDVAILQRLLAKPAGFYVNLHTTVNPGGAIRGQFTKLVETVAGTVAMSTANEVPPVTNVNASGTGTITVNPVRNPTTGAVTGGTVTFTVAFDFPGSVTITGLHIHEAAAGVNGVIVIDTRITASNPVVSASGKGTINISVPITFLTPIGVLQRLLQNPAGFYVNLHTSVNPGGAIRAQLATLAGPPIIQQSNTYFLETGTTDAQISLLVSGIDLTSTMHVNGQMVQAVLDINTGGLGVVIPAALRSSAGTLFVQARNASGLLSAPVALVVADQANVNSVAATTTDAARYATTVTPETIAAAFGTNLATQTLAATSLPLPTSLDGTTVYVNGIAAPLIFVSPNQVNYQIPPGTLPGSAQVVVVNRNGIVSRGQVSVANTAPGLFTSNRQGTGAPAAVASADGQTFNILMGNTDGTPREIEAGYFVALFGTGFRFASGAATMSAGGTNITPLFVGAQGLLAGLDQINLRIPTAMAGRGEVDLVVTVDGKTANAVKLKIK
jgi:uncharacterized protein (TIGR03437 family)